MTPKQKAFVIEMDKMYAAKKLWEETGKVARTGALSYYYTLMQSETEVEDILKKMLLKAVSPIHTGCRFHVQADAPHSGARQVTILAHNQAGKHILKLYQELSLELELSDGVTDGS